MPHKVKVAVIGAGNMGKNHIRTYQKLPNVELVALVDVNEAAAAIAEEHGILYLSDYKDLLRDGQIDAVSIVVPTPFHFKIAMDFIEHGIHCLVEKPITSTIDEANQLIAAAKKHSVIFTVGHIEQYNPMIQKLKTLIDKKEIGEITSIITRRVGGFPSIEPRTDVIIDLAVHDIDIMSYLLGKQPKAVHSHGSRTLHSHKVDSAELLLDYGTASGFVQANWITPVKVRNIAVTGTKGYVEGNYITQELTYYKHSMEPKRKGFKNFVATLGEPEKYYVSEDPKEPLAIELGAFTEAVLGHKVDLVDPAAARDALQVVLTALEDMDNAK